MRALTYTRWWVLQEMARGRLLFVPNHMTRYRSHFHHLLAGLGEVPDIVPPFTAKAIVTKGEATKSGDLGMSVGSYGVFTINEVGKARIADRPAWSLAFTDWLVGKYGPRWAKKWDGLPGVSLCSSPLRQVTLPAQPTVVQTPAGWAMLPPPPFPPSPASPPFPPGPAGLGSVDTGATGTEEA